MDSFNLSIFLFAVLGVLAIQLLDFYNTYAKGKEQPHFLRSPLFWGIQVVLGITAGFVAIVLELDRPVYALFFGMAFPLFIRKLAEQNKAKLREFELEEDLKIAEQTVEREPDKSKPVWEVSRLQLEIYINKNQSQVNSIYWITVLVMVLGFALVGYGVYQAVNGSKIDAALLTTAAGVVSQFIVDRGSNLYS